VIKIEKNNNIVTHNAVSCGGIIIRHGKVLLLYKNHNGRYVGWVLPKGSIEKGESLKQTALREVEEEAGVKAKIIKYVGATHYKFKNPNGEINKIVHWFLMSVDSYYCKPQAEENFADAGFYKRHEAHHLLKYSDERQIMLKAFDEYEKNKKKINSNGIKIMNS